MITTDIAVLYHGKCPDGFGGAYAAWKKFGDAATYIPVGYGEPIPEGLDGKEVYIVDFCYELPGQIEDITSRAKRLVVLDHHESNRPRVEGVKEHVYDAKRSGATIAWSYFHPDEPVPHFMTYLEDGDLYKYALPETRDIFSYLLTLPYEFAAWDALREQIEDPKGREELIQKSKAYTEFFKSLSHMSIERAKKVRFEGHEVYFVATHPAQTMKSYVGNELYKKLPPFALIVTAHPNGFGVSIRGDAKVIDVSKIAEKYGGGGHPGSAGFFIPNGEHMPWTEVEGETSASSETVAA
jgi:oligoribonuclease NrnB/cAMP/cGMP phosphodiesterase (DHH superfamily)